MLLADNIPDRTVVCEGREYLFFSGTAYLGMNSNKEFQHYLQEGMTRYGTNYSSSRNSNFRLEIYEQAEHHLAMAAGAEAALTVSSGYMAAQLVINMFKEQGKFIFAPGAHPALWTKPSDATNIDYDEWAASLLNTIHQNDSPEFFIITNSLDPILARQYDFRWTASLPENKKITLVIDDSHGLGITGNNGEGIYSHIKRSFDIRLVVVSSLGKAMGIPGGVIISDRDTISIMKKSPYFNTSSPIAPAYLSAYISCGDLYRQRRALLFDNINHFRSLTRDLPVFRSIENYPVFYTGENKLYPFLLQKNILISSFAYPLPGDNAVTRIVISSSHRLNDIDFLVDCVKEYQQSHFLHRIPV